MINPDALEQASSTQRSEPLDPAPLRIIVRSRYPVMQAGVCIAISRQYPGASVECLIELTDVPQLLAAGTRHLLILHLSQATASKRADLQQLRRSHPDTKILLIAPNDSRDMVLWGLDAGVHGVVIPSATPSQLQEAMRSVMAGRIYVPPVTATLPPAGGETAPPAGCRTDHIALTLRQSQVLQLLAEGRSNKEIARKLGLAPGTVKVHVGRLFATLGAHSRVEAIVKVGATRGLAPDST